MRLKELWNRSDIDPSLETYWKRGDRIYKTVSIADDPTICIEEVLTEKREHYVISSPLFAEFERLVPQKPEDG